MLALFYNNTDFNNVNQGGVMAVLNDNKIKAPSRNNMKFFMESLIHLF